MRVPKTWCLLAITSGLAWATMLHGHRHHHAEIVRRLPKALDDQCIAVAQVWPCDQGRTAGDGLSTSISSTQSATRSVPVYHQPSTSDSTTVASTTYSSTKPNPTTDSSAESTGVRSAPVYHQPSTIDSIQSASTTHSSTKLVHQPSTLKSMKSAASTHSSTQLSQQRSTLGSTKSASSTHSSTKPNIYSIKSAASTYSSTKPNMYSIQSDASTHSSTESSEVHSVPVYHQPSIIDTTKSRSTNPSSTTYNVPVYSPPSIVISSGHSILADDPSVHLYGRPSQSSHSTTNGRTATIPIPSVSKAVAKSWARPSASKHTAVDSKMITSLDHTSCREASGSVLCGAQQSFTTTTITRTSTCTKTIKVITTKKAAEPQSHKTRNTGENLTSSARKSTTKEGDSLQAVWRPTRSPMQSIVTYNSSGPLTMAKPTPGSISGTSSKASIARASGTSQPLSPVSAQALTTSASASFLTPSPALSLVSTAHPEPAYTGAARRDWPELQTVVFVITTCLLTVQSLS